MSLHDVPSYGGIAVLGEALVDVFPDRAVLGGAPFNVARNLAALGLRPLLLTRLGNDAHGQHITAECQRWSMPVAGLQRDASRPTGTVQVHLQPDGHRFEIGADAAWDHLDAEGLLPLLQQEAPSLAYFGTLAQRSATSRRTIRAALDVLIDAGAACLLDLNLRGTPDDRSIAEASLGLADVVKVNAEEFDQLLAWFVDPALPALRWRHAARRDAAAALVSRYRLDRLVITRGALGWACFDPACGGWFEGASPAVAVVDTVGAGDAFSAVLLLGMARQWPLPLTLLRAGSFAAAVCTLRGAVDAGSPIYAATRAGWSL